MRRTMLLVAAAVVMLAVGSGAALGTSYCGDTIEGEAGDDRLIGDQYGPCYDIIRGAGGNDLMRGLSLPDTLYGGPDSDEMYGGTWGDRMRGGDGADELYGERGKDRIEGGSGIDILYGGDGDDTINAQDLGESGPASRDIIRCGPGHDLVLMDAEDNERPRGCEEAVVGIE